MTCNDIYTSGNACTEHSCDSLPHLPSSEHVPSMGATKSFAATKKIYWYRMQHECVIYTLYAYAHSSQILWVAI